MDDRLWFFRARIMRVVDADTLELELDTGFHSRHIERVRLRDVDAPERGTPEGKSATAWVRRWLANSGNSGYWGLRVRTHQVDSRHGLIQDASLGRYVADVSSAATGESLADALIAAGHAARWEPKP